MNIFGGNSFCDEGIFCILQNILLGNQGNYLDTELEKFIALAHYVGVVKISSQLG